jgi:predicted metal-binding membrane protein
MTTSPKALSPAATHSPTGRRDRAVVLWSLLGLTALAWFYLIRLSGDMGSAAGVWMTPYGAAWNPADFALAFGQWTVMMLAMMLPTIAPLLWTYVAMLRARPEPSRVYPLAALLTAGYLAVWVAFSLAGALAQWGLQAAALRLPAPSHTGVLLGGAFLIATGLFQWTPFKHACLAHCRTPQGFFMTHWQEGGGGAWRMGLHQGVLCTGCCWLLMGLMLLAGAMNLWWMGALTALVLVEKVAPSGEWLGRAAGVLLAAWGLWLVASGLL